VKDKPTLRRRRVEGFGQAAEPDTSQPQFLDGFDQLFHRALPAQDLLFENFIKYDYAETKDLAKSFLTLVSAILVFPLTFAEKIVDFQKASTLLKTIMVASWGMFIIAISLTGLAICFITLAFDNALYKQWDYFNQATTAWELMIGAGVTFVLGLLILVIAAGFSAFMPKQKIQLRETP
jgi:hypothetical protein